MRRNYTYYSRQALQRVSSLLSHDKGSMPASLLYRERRVRPMYEIQSCVVVPSSHLTRCKNADMNETLF